MFLSARHSHVDRRTFLKVASLAAAPLVTRGAPGAEGLPVPAERWPASLSLPRLGTLKVKPARAIAASALGVGMECLDRRMYLPEKTYGHLAALGVKWARVQTGWSRCETSQGVYDFACQRLCTLFDRATQPIGARARLAGDRLTVPADSLTQVCFLRGQHPLFAYWWPEALQKDVAPQTVDVVLPAEQDWTLRSPVLADLTAGEYYRLNGQRHGASWSFRGLPLTDYPLLITDAAVVA